MSEITLKNLKDIDNGKFYPYSYSSDIKLLRFLTYAKVENSGKRYLYIGETEKNIKNISQVFNEWIVNDGMIDQYSRVNESHIVTFPPPADPTTLFGKIKKVLRKPYKSSIVTFKFLSATEIDWIQFHNREFNEIVLDLLYTTQQEKYNIIKQAMDNRIKPC